MKVATILLAGSVLICPTFAGAQTLDGNGKPIQTNLVKVPRGAVATTETRSAKDTDRVIDDELKRIDRMMSICTGC